MERDLTREFQRGRVIETMRVMQRKFHGKAEDKEFSLKKFNRNLFKRVFKDSFVHVRTILLINVQILTQLKLVIIANYFSFSLLRTFTIDY